MVYLLIKGNYYYIDLAKIDLNKNTNNNNLKNNNIIYSALSLS
jgi:hypothetical protein